MSAVESSPALPTRFQGYRVLERMLREHRTLFGVGTASESSILEAMATLWPLLSESERDQLDAEGPTCFPNTEHERCSLCGGEKDVEGWCGLCGGDR